MGIFSMSFSQALSVCHTATGEQTCSTCLQGKSCSHLYQTLINFCFSRIFWPFVQVVITMAAYSIGKKFIQYTNQFEKRF